MTTADDGRLSPAVRRVAKQHGIDLAGVKGSGADGRITRDDVLVAAGLAEAAAPPAPERDDATQEPAEHVGVETAVPAEEERDDATQEPAESAGEEPVVPVEGERDDATQESAEPAGVETAVPPEGERDDIPQAPPDPATEEARGAGAGTPAAPAANPPLAAAIKRSLEEPHTTNLFEFAADGLGHDRSGESALNLDLLALAVAASAAALRAVPELNARYVGDRIELRDAINIACVADSAQHGFVLPVLHGADGMDRAAIRAALESKMELGGRGKVDAGDLGAGTFTIFASAAPGTLLTLPPIINRPQVAALAIGGVALRAVAADDGGVVARPMVYAALGSDYRVVDRAAAGRWVAEFAARIT